MSNLVFVAQFVASKVGLDGLSPTWDIERITRSDGTRSALVTGGATNIAIGRRGQYGYLLTGADLTLYAYTATAITADASVDQKEMAAMADLVLADTIQVSGDAGAADNLELFFDGTGYASAGSINSVLGSVGSIATGGITSGSFATDAITATAIAANAIGSSELAATAAAEIAAAVIAGGAGTYSYSNTVDDGSGNFLDGVFIQLSTNAGFTNIVNTTHTNSLGAFTVYSDIAGTHYLRLQRGDMTFTDQTVTLA